jgi:hypothetical protein
MEEERERKTSATSERWVTKYIKRDSPFFILIRSILTHTYYRCHMHPQLSDKRDGEYQGLTIPASS